MESATRVKGETSMAHYKGAASEGTRAVNLLKKRERAREELEKLKQKISEVCEQATTQTVAALASSFISPSGPPVEEQV